MNTPPGKAWQADDGWHVDTRGLEPPDPMVAILWHVENTPGPIIAHMDRNPIHLYPELAERGWVGELASEAPGDTRLILRAMR